jgi:hypothetical protein
MGWFLLIVGVVALIVLVSVAIYRSSGGPARRTRGATGGYVGWTYADDYDGDDDDRGSGDGGWGDGGSGDSGGDGGGGDGGGGGGD